MNVPVWQNDQRAALLEDIPSGIVVIDRQHTIVDHNRAFADLFGEARGQPCFAVTKGRGAPCLSCPARDTFADGRRRVIEETGRDRAGRDLHYLVQMTPLRNEAGVVTHVAAVTTDLTATRRLQREYQTLFEKVPCYVAVLNRDYRVVKANEMFRAVFGEPTGERCYELFKKRHAPCEDCPAAATFADGASHTSRHVGLSQDGRPTHYVVSTAPLLRGAGEAAHVIEMCLDVTESQQLADQLARENVLREALVDCSLDAIVVLGPAGRIRLFNPAAERLWGVRRDQVIGRRVPSRLLPAELRPLLSGRTDRLLREATVASPGGELVPVRLAGIALRAGNERMGTAVIAQDLREIKELERANLEAERLAAVGQTVAGLAHGIKNILTGLEGGMYVTSTGLQKNDASRVQRGWQMLERNMGRISELARNLLAFSRGEVLRPARTDPAELVRQAGELFQERARQHGIAMTVQIQPGVATAPLDAEGLRSCLDNLLSNAIDACLVSSKEESRIVLGLREEDDDLVFEVSDTGCGMDYEVMQKAFTSFFTTKGAGGTGLGLLLTRKIAQQHGGTVTFTSEPGQGTTFRIVLPRRRLPGAEAGEAAGPKRGGGTNGDPPAAAKRAGRRSGRERG